MPAGASTMNPVPGARIVLGGHPSRPARLVARRYPGWARLARTLAFVVLWIASTLGTLVFTFDPFVASLPFLMGISFVYRSWKGRFRVEEFQAACPRCGEELKLKPGSKIDLPHPLVCYHCHHEPELAA
ncbi:MAG TPA: hypothetical protein VK399_09395 [Longimicrobiaceae bacterium]|jgi:hypothetical protein|nr:hypothetical protein [Longimicrobiaceae bacterium]